MFLTSYAEAGTDLGYGLKNTEKGYGADHNKCKLDFSEKKATIPFMRIVHPPIHRKVIIPWYDANMVCFMGFTFAVFVFIFSIIGIWVANHTPEYEGYAWIPGTLTALSAWGAISIGYRVIKRCVNLYRDEF